MAQAIERTMGNRPFLRDARERLAALCFDHFEVIPQSPTIGAEVRGLSLAEPLRDDVLKALRTALVEFKVLFFRDQEIDVRAQSRFASRFGELERHPFLPSNTEHAHVIRFAKDEQTVGYENIWHSDVSWRQRPSLGSVLRAIEVPPVGGDTLWCDMEAAYEGLSDDVKDTLAGRTAVHDFAYSFGRMLPPDELERRRAEFPPAEHPIFRTHPESGRRCIYVNRVFTHHVTDMSEDESDAVLELLYAQAHVPEYHFRLRWSPGTVAFWDNRSTQHYAVNDYWPMKRVMERVTVIGDRPR
ncbi:MAG TPA: taurine dioxygenase [Alphaproteobacteria bacterium]|nr:taurine dioxygenase [Alphaproteobacteria bacterium]